MLRRRPIGLLALVIAVTACVIWGCDQDSKPRPTGEATLVGFSNGECQREQAQARAYSSEEPKVEIITDGLLVMINHKNAMFNCCLDTILVDLAQEENLLILTEAEIATHPCHCICPYEVSASLEVSLPGQYQVEIWAEESLIWAGDVTVTENGR